MAKSYPSTQPFGEMLPSDESSREKILKNRELLFSNPRWNELRFQLQNRISGKNLELYFQLTESERIGIEQTVRLNVSTTPYYLSLSSPFDPSCPIRRMIVPTQEETVLSPEENPDPLREEDLSPVPGLTHMYPDRVLLFSNHECSVYCRHCMRGRKVSYSEERMDFEKLSRAFEYVRSHPEITDVVLSGGDPLNLSDSKLDWILEELESIPSVKIVRIGTRNPVTNPMRFTDSLLSIIEKHNSDNLSIFCNTQFNHPKECTKESKEVILKLLKVGVSVGNQAVLLKGINDSGEVMLELHRRLLEMRVRAYYLYDPELIPGSRGFRTPLYKGIEIIAYMRGKIGGMGIPVFVNDLPGGGGKVSISPNWYLGFHERSGNHIFRSAVRGTYHLSPEPIGSEYIDKYPKVSDELYESIRSNLFGAHGKV